MTQRDLNRAVASRTGESVAEISRRGFVPLTRIPVELEPGPPACQPVDWDALDRGRIGVLFPQRARPASAF
jgi:hypothetical protein